MRGKNIKDIWNNNLSIDFCLCQKSTLQFKNTATGYAKAIAWTRISIYFFKGAQGIGHNKDVLRTNLAGLDYYYPSLYHMLELPCRPTDVQLVRSDRCG